MLVADGGGGGGAMYAVQIESLEEFQQKLTTILQDLEANNNVMSLGDGASTYGKFPEAQNFATAYEQTKQDLINAFNEVTQLVNTMISVAGANAAKYKQTEQDITAKFNSILQQYGDTPTTTTSTSGATYQPGSTTGSGGPAGTTTTYATQSNPGTSGSSSSGSSTSGSNTSGSGTSGTDNGTSSGGSSSSSSNNAAGNAA